MSNIRITKQFSFETGHALYGYDGKCKNVHGHSYRLDVTVIGTPISDNSNVKYGMVIDFSDLNSESIFIVSQQRHDRKLRTGCHKGNKFTITLRNVTQPLDILCRINAVRAGVPNYFGEQRFGHDGHNLEMAKRMFVYVVTLDGSEDLNRSYEHEN